MQRVEGRGKCVGVRWGFRWGSSLVVVALCSTPLTTHQTLRYSIRLQMEQPFHTEAIATAWCDRKVLSHFVKGGGETDKGERIPGDPPFPPPCQPFLRKPDLATYTPRRYLLGHTIPPPSPRKLVHRRTAHRPYTGSSELRWSNKLRHNLDWDETWLVFKPPWVKLRRQGLQIAMQIVPLVQLRTRKFRLLSLS